MSKYTVNYIDYLCKYYGYDSAYTHEYMYKYDYLSHRVYVEIAKRIAERNIQSDTKSDTKSDAEPRTIIVELFDTIPYTHEPDQSTEEHVPPGHVNMTLVLTRKVVPVSTLAKLENRIEVFLPVGTCIKAGAPGQEQILMLADESFNIPNISKESVKTHGEIKLPHGTKFIPEDCGLVHTLTEPMIISISGLKMILTKDTNFVLPFCVDIKGTLPKGQVITITNVSE